MSAELLHVHQWVRHGFGTGTSESTTLWGPARCWCGAVAANIGDAGAHDATSEQAGHA